MSFPHHLELVGAGEEVWLRFNMLTHCGPYDVVWIASTDKLLLLSTTKRHRAVNELNVKSFSNFSFCSMEW